MVIVPRPEFFSGLPIAATNQTAGFQDPGEIQSFSKWVHGANCTVCIDFGTTLFQEASLYTRCFRNAVSEAIWQNGA
ncbi:hypothetical protein PM082_020838 [Marasmius tenuissimus]|nr:hypothetical protein PM082_020838 [Marasmius tenuissimus]